MSGNRGGARPSFAVFGIIKLHKGAAKIPNFGNLKIRPSLLDKLILSPPKRSFPPEVQAAIFKEAETKWVGLTRAYQLEHEIKRAEEAAYKRDIEAIEGEERYERKIPEPFPLGCRNLGRRCLNCRRRPQNPRHHCGHASSL
jgi:hypothetical protein